MIVVRHKLSLLSIPKSYEMAIGLGLIFLSLLFYRFPSLELVGDILAIIAAVICGKSIVLDTLKGVIKGKLNADELITLAIVGSFFLGEYLVAAEVAFIMTMGAFLEDKVVDRSRKAIGELSSLIPHEARIRHEGDFALVPISQVKINDLVLVKLGEEIPVDGIIISGMSSVSEASLTGESKPLIKNSGDFVYAGALNMEGALEIKTLKIGKQSALGRMVTLTEEALKEKTPVMRLADRYASWLTPIVLFFTLVVFLLTGDIYRAIAVLVVACPRSLVLAIPTALTAALGKAVKQGILIRGGVFLNKAAEVDTILFDKSGTLTLGKPQVVKVIPLNGFNRENLLLLAAIAEKFSEHPIGQAIVREAKKQFLVIPDPQDIRVVPGKGLVVNYNGSNITVGNTGFLRDGEFKFSQEAREISTKEEEIGRTTFFVAEDQDIRGIISLEDVIRDETLVSLASLKKIVSRVILLTGDNYESAYKVATETGIGEFRAKLLPEDKVNTLLELRSEGLTIAAVGDGINDAPLLASADVGIAMGGSGSHLTLEAASVVLLKDDLAKLPVFFKLARDTKAIIRQNLFFFAIAYNLIAFLLASLGYLNPLGGAIVHNIASFAVILNSRRLLRGK
ncbi:MAG: putative manganese/zinc-exporting P-type ATPase [candidate division WS2 bacterium]|uniref:Manganese/zinc-exporting P-type ATPase n=1 Tax=Psychracetigena formicireducens TaxID=2986056 RepID=A0A9E2F569_PSYF1|nr:putative manganese/zinc-exporting P-type ATPase [Candidatus Psychracetigena formicireducens]